MLRLAFDFIITWRETRTRPNAYYVPSLAQLFISFPRQTTIDSLFSRQAQSIPPE